MTPQDPSEASSSKARRLLLSRRAADFLGSENSHVILYSCDSFAVVLESAAGAIETGVLRQMSIQDRLFGEISLRLPQAAFFDMDATTIVEESIVVLAEAAGRRDEIHRITERAMAGELDFEPALRQRVAMLAGVPWEVVSTLHQRLTLNPGITALFDALKKNGIPYYLVSGGFNTVLKPIAAACGFAGYHANTLDHEHGKLTGKVIGTLVDAEEKRRYLVSTADSLGLDPKVVMAVGDGANDLPMLQRAGIAVGFNPKPILFPHLAVICGQNHYEPLVRLLFS